VTGRDNTGTTGGPDRIALLIVALGLCLRLAAAVPFASRETEGEAARAALAFATTGTIADSFGPGQGPTAHLSPVMPVLAGSIHRLFGPGTPAAHYAQSALAAVLVAFAALCLNALFARAGTPRAWRLAGLAVLAIAPLSEWLDPILPMELVSFRAWEGALAVALGLGGALWLHHLQSAGDIGDRTIAGVALLAAFTFVTSPPMGVALYLCCAVVMLQLPRRRWPGMMLVATAALALLVVPWAWRNQRQLGEPVWLRSNFGLELALANHDAAVDPADPAAVMRGRLDAIHPFRSAANLARMQAAGGEVAYARALGAESRAWIAAHPTEFVRLCARHLAEYFVPPAWHWRVVYADLPAARQAAVHGTIGILGLAGALAALAVAARTYLLALIMLMVPALPYAITQPNLRYHYLAFGLLVMFAADLAGRVERALRRA
jgi:hypothetical protein